MDIVVIGLSFILGTIFYVLINKIFKIYYFGLKGILSTYAACWGVAIAILNAIGLI